MLPITAEQFREFTELSNENKPITELSERELKLIAKYRIKIRNEELYNWLDDVEVDLVDNLILDSSTHISYKVKTAVLKIYHRRNVKSMILDIGDYFDTINEQIISGKNIENILPYSLEMLFHDQNPKPNKIDVLDYFRDGNLAYVKLKTTRRLQKANKHGEYSVDNIRDMVIHEWKPGEFSVKRKDFTTKFIEELSAKRAPKAKLLAFEIKHKFAHRYNEVADDWVEISKSKSGENFLIINNRYSFNRYSNWSISKIFKTVVKYHDGDKLWIRGYECIFENGNQHIRKFADAYYVLNDYGGITRVEENPLEDKNLIEELSQEEFIIPSVGIKDTDYCLTTSEDEEEIIIPYDYEYVNIELTKSNPYVREYTITNMPNEEKRKEYFAKYEDKWVATNHLNPKVIQMLEDYKLAELLIEEG